MTTAEKEKSIGEVKEAIAQIEIAGYKIPWLGELLVSPLMELKAKMKFIDYYIYKEGKDNADCKGQESNTGKGNRLCL